MVPGGAGDGLAEERSGGAGKGKVWGFEGWRKVTGSSRPRNLGAEDGVEESILFLWGVNVA